MSRKVYLLPAAFAFLLCMVSLYFGASIYNANENVHIDYLNEMDHIDYYDASLVPALTGLAAILTLPFIVGTLGTEIYILLKASQNKIRRIAQVILVLHTGLLLLAIITISDPEAWDFSHTGYAWIFTGLFTIAGNVFSIFFK